MFYITENDFINNDVIKYKDENNLIYNERKKKWN